MDEEQANELPVLESQCDECDGHGWVDKHGCRNCRACNASGFKPTRAGRQILALLSHHVRMDGEND